MTVKLAFRTLFDLSSQLFACPPSAIPPLLVLALFAVTPPAFCQEGTISGTVVDSSGASVARAQVTLSLEGGRPDRETQSTEAGDFSFANVEAGPYHLSFTAVGFAVRVVAGELRAGEISRLPTITLDVATFSAQVNVTPSRADIAEAQIKVEEQQRILGIF